MEYVELTYPVPWGVIAAKGWGDPCLPAVLMVHGIQDNAGSFDRIMPLLPKFFYYVCIDLPGHGKSTRFPKGILLHHMLYLSSIRRVVLQLQWKKYVYIGHSLGGQLGTYYTALYPEEVTKLVLLDTLTPLVMTPKSYLKFCRENIKKMFELENKLLNSNPPNYSYEEALGRMLSSRMSPISEDAAEALIKRALKVNKKNFYYFSTDQRLKLGVLAFTTKELQLSVVLNIECPVLLVITNVLLDYIEGTEKNQSYDTLKLLEKKSNFQMVRVSGFHDVHNNNPETVAPHINKFLLQPKSVL